MTWSTARRRHRDICGIAALAQNDEEVKSEEDERVTHVARRYTRAPLNPCRGLFPCVCDGHHEMRRDLSQRSTLGVWRQFSFLVTEFGCLKVRSRFKRNGFELRCLGPSVGFVVECFPRDPLTVLLARLVNGDFPPSTAAINHFDLGDIESLVSALTRLDDRRLYGMPDDEMAGLMTRSLREYSSSLLRGDLSLIPQLEQRIKDRQRRYQAEMQNRMRGNKSACANSGPAQSDDEARAEETSAPCRGEGTRLYTGADHD
jgi:hypothetical protein